MTAFAPSSSLIQLLSPKLDQVDHAKLPVLPADQTAPTVTQSMIDVGTYIVGIQSFSS